MPGPGRPNFNPQGQIAVIRTGQEISIFPLLEFECDGKSSKDYS